MFYRQTRRSDINSLQNNCRNGSSCSAKGICIFVEVYLLAIKDIGFKRTGTAL